MTLALLPAAALAQEARDLDGGVCDDPDSSFPDIASGEIDQAAGCLADFGIAQGFPDGNYRPGVHISREQMASFLARKLEAANEYDTPETVPPAAYTDRAQIADVHLANVDMVTHVGIAEGKDDGSFDPGGNVTRAQMAAFIVRQIEEMTGEEMDRPETNNFNDSDVWAEDYIEKLGAAGISVGDGEGNFMPHAFTTRGQMALFIARDLDYLAEEHGFTFTPIGEEPVAESFTDAPELVGATIVRTVTPTQATTADPEGTTVRFTFDENVVDVSPVPSRFRVWKYNHSNTTTADADTQGNGLYIGNATVSVDGPHVEIRFNALTQASDVNDLTLATVRFQAVRDFSGVPNPEGDAGIGTTTDTTVGQAGVTTAPDLQSVSGFRAAHPDFASNARAVDFTFNQNAWVIDTTGFELVRVDNMKVACQAPGVGDTTAGGGSRPGGNGTTTITAICTPGGGELPPSSSNTARGVVHENSVQDRAWASGGPNTNVLQVAVVAGGTSGPDIVSVEFRPRANNTDQVLYTFDKDVTVTDTGNFRVYTLNAGEENSVDATVNPANARQVLATFGMTSLDNAVGASVEMGAVTGTAGVFPQFNQEDERGVSNPRTVTRTSGATAGPDLTGVATAANTDGFGNIVSGRATYTFSENVNVTGDVNNRLFLYDEDGNQISVSGCASPAVTGAGADTVVCTYTATSQAAVDRAVLGTAVAGAVTGNSTGLVNPEGAEGVS